MKKISMFLLIFAFPSMGYSLDCEVEKISRNKTIRKNFKKKNKISYSYSKTKDLNVQINKMKNNEQYLITYVSRSGKGEKTGSTSYSLTCDKYLSCSGFKEHKYSYYAKKEKVALTPNGYSVSMRAGGRDVLTYINEGNGFKFKFVDLVYPEGDWKGAEVNCEL